MKPPRSLVAAASTVALSVVCFGCAERLEPEAPLFEGMGAFQRSITTRSELAQRYFNQGLVLAYGFNHGEAARSFREASRQDPECAMCQWGLALVLGPNINAAMEAADVAEAAAASRRAVELASDASEVERALIEALAVRYTEPAPEDRSDLDHAFADAMATVYERFPDDLDVGTIYAESLMDTTPWDYWTDDGEPKPVTATFLEVLEGVLDRYAHHPGANHLYIHAVEAVHPERGVAAAERLENLVPGSGHLVHMPSHIYIRVGRYHDASVSNQRAIEADDAYATQCHAMGLYPIAYMPHNEHFLWAASSLEGRSAVAIDAARQLADGIDPDMMREEGFGTLQHFHVTPIYALVRFGKWGEILLEPQPDADLLYPNGVWRYARAIAHIRLGQFEEAEAELAELDVIADDPALESITIWDLNTTASLLRIARLVVIGELAAARGDVDAAIGHLTTAVELEDDLNYDEPPPWYAPVRQTLGVVYLVADRPTDAEQVYLADLERFPENGWSLYGLAQARQLQNDTIGAREARSRFQTAWQHADIELTSSRM